MQAIYVKYFVNTCHRHNISQGLGPGLNGQATIILKILVFSCILLNHLDWLHSVPFPCQQRTEKI